MRDDSREIANGIAYWNNWCLDKQNYGTHKTHMLFKEKWFYCLMLLIRQLSSINNPFTTVIYLYHTVIRLKLLAGLQHENERKEVSSRRL